MADDTILKNAIDKMVVTLSHRIKDLFPDRHLQIPEVSRIAVKLLGELETLNKA